MTMEFTGRVVLRDTEDTTKPNTVYSWVASHYGSASYCGGQDFQYMYVCNGDYRSNSGEIGKRRIASAQVPKHHIPRICVAILGSFLNHFGRPQLKMHYPRISPLFRTIGRDITSEGYFTGLFAEFISQANGWYLRSGSRYAGYEWWQLHSSTLHHRNPNTQTYVYAAQYYFEAIEAPSLRGGATVLDIDQYLKLAANADGVLPE